MHCPVCGNPHLYDYEKHINFKRIDYLECHNCGWRSDRVYVSSQEGKNEPDPNNPYADFAKEMSLLHEALKAEGFKDAMVDILAAMGPVVWNKIAAQNLEKMITATIEAKIDENTMLFKEETK